jgi:alpha-tubulin suppressor-like RCC1 family protein
VVAAGTSHTCALTSAGAAWCWGANDTGQLGVASTSTSCQSVPCARRPVAVAGAPTFASITAGRGFTCALTPAGAAWCWGRNDYGQLGNGTTTRTSVPVPVAGSQAFTRISVEENHACALSTAGALYCWGENGYGQLGDGSTAHRRSPTLVTGGGTYVDVSAGGSHTCAVRTDGAAYCWGGNYSGQLGAPGMTASSVPVAVAGGHTFTTVSAATRHTCAMRGGDGILMCWGAANEGRLGINESVHGEAGVPTSVRAPGS